MKIKLLPLFLFIFFIWLYLPYGSPVIVIVVDDVSPLHSTDEQRELFRVIERYGFNATVSVIPFHYGKSICDSNELVSIINSTKFEVAQHGYMHNYKEFENLDYPEAKRRVILGRKIIEGCIGKVYEFRAPWRSESRETKQILKELKYCDVTDTYIEHEFTWYLDSYRYPLYITFAKFELLIYGKFHIPYVLVLHVHAANYGEGIKFLNNFLSFAKSRNAKSKTLREVACEN